MSEERQPLAENNVDSADSSELPFDLNKEKAEMSFYLKQKHGLPPVTVTHLLNQFSTTAKREREDQSLIAILSELAGAILKKYGELRPMSIAIKDYAASKGVVFGNSENGAKPADGAPVAGTADETAKSVAGVFAKDEIPSAVRNKLPDILNMGLEDAVRACFPSMNELLVKTLYLKLTQGPTAEEEGDPTWQVRYFSDLVQRFETLKADLDTQGFHLDSVARMLAARGQLEANRNETGRAERKAMSSRERLDTVHGIDVSQLGIEQALASVRQGQGDKDGIPHGDQGSEIELGTAALSPDEQAAVEDGADAEDLLAAKVAGAPAVLITQIPTGTNEDDVHSRTTWAPPESPDAGQSVPVEAAKSPIDPGAEGRMHRSEVVTVPVSVAEVKAHLAKSAEGAGPEDAGSEQPASTMRSGREDTHPAIPHPHTPERKSKRPSGFFRPLKALKSLVGMGEDDPEKK